MSRGSIMGYWGGDMVVELSQKSSGPAPAMSRCPLRTALPIVTVFLLTYPLFPMILPGLFHPFLLDLYPEGRKNLDGAFYYPAACTAWGLARAAPSSHMPTWCHQRTRLSTLASRKAINASLDPCARPRHSLGNDRYSDEIFWFDQQLWVDLLGEVRCRVAPCLGWGWGV